MARPRAPPTPRGSTARRLRYLVGAALGEAHHLALVAGHELGRDHARRPRRAPASRPAAGPCRGGTPARARPAPRPPASSAPRRTGAPRRAGPAAHGSRLHAARASITAVKTVRRQKAHAPARIGTSNPRTDTVSARAPRRSVPPRSRDSNQEGQDPPAGRPRSATALPTRSHGKITTNSAPTTNQATRPRSMPRGPSPPARAPARRASRRRRRRRTSTRPGDSARRGWPRRASRRRSRAGGRSPA